MAVSADLIDFMIAAALDVAGDRCTGDLLRSVADALTDLAVQLDSIPTQIGTTVVRKVV